MLIFIQQFLCKFICHKGKWKSTKCGLQLQAYDFRTCERCGNHEFINHRKLYPKSVHEVERLKMHNPNKFFDCYGEEVKQEDDYLEMLNRIDAKRMK